MMALVLVALVVIGCYLGFIASDVADIKILLKDVARRADDGK